MSKSSTSSYNEPYNYRRPSIPATRALIDPHAAPQVQHGTISSSPADPDVPHATVHRRRTNNYETAVADKLKAALESKGQVSADLDVVDGPTDTAAGHVGFSGVPHKGDNPSSSISDNATGVTSSTPNVVSAAGSAAPAGSQAQPPLLSLKPGQVQAAPQQPDPKSNPKPTDDASHVLPSTQAAVTEHEIPGPDVASPLGRQLSFRQSDQKRAHMEKMLSDDGSVLGAGTGKKGGYTSSST